MPSSSVFSIPTKDNRQVAPSRKEQQLRLMAPSVSSSASVGHKRKLHQMEDGDKDVQLHQRMSRDKRLRLDQQQISSSSSIGLKKKSSITISSSEHRQALSTTIRAATDVDLCIPSTATFRHSMTAESNDAKNRVNNKTSELLFKSSTQKRVYNPMASHHSPVAAAVSATSVFNISDYEGDDVFIAADPIQ